MASQQKRGGLTLAHRLYSWPKVSPALGQRLVFAGNGIVHPYTTGWVMSWPCPDQGQAVGTKLHFIFFDLYSSIVRAL